MLRSPTDWSSDWCACALIQVWEHLHSGGNIVALHAAAKASLEKNASSAGASSSRDNASEVLQANGLATPRVQPGGPSQNVFELRSPDRSEGGSDEDVGTSGRTEGSSEESQSRKASKTVESLVGGKAKDSSDGARLHTNAAASTSGNVEASSAVASNSRKATKQKGAAAPESIKQPTLGSRGPNLGIRNSAANASTTTGKPPPGVKKGPQSGLDLPIPVSLQERGSQPGVFTSDAGVGDMIEAVLYLTAMDGHFEALAAALEALHNCLLVAARPQEVSSSTVELVF
jgi:hypothetical protein